MSTAIVPQNKREEELVRLGKTEANAALKKKEQKAEVKRLKKEASAARREAKNVLEDEAPISKLAAGGGLVIGGGAGVAAQHYLMDKHVANKYVRAGTLPTVGGLGLLGGLLVSGPIGNFLFGAGAGLALGSGATSMAKHLSK